MKTYLTLTIAAAFISANFFAQTSTGKSGYSDDVYFSSKDAAVEKAERARKKEEAELKKQNKKKQVVAANQPENGNDDYYQPNANQDSETASNANSSNNKSYQDKPFNQDDYYDYEYATRLRRFHNNCGSYGYYDSYYTNSYWYSGNPYNYGTSVYMGYNFWGPTYYTYSYYPNYYYYSSMGWGYDPWYRPYGYGPYGYYGYNNYWNYGYNPYAFGYGNGYYNGYNQGYWNGYYNGYYNGMYGNNNYFNSYDHNSYYYGPRKNMSANSSVTSQPTTLAQRYVQSVEKETGKPFEATMGRDNNPYTVAVSPAVNENYTKPTSGLNNKPNNQVISVGSGAVSNPNVNGASKDGNNASYPANGNPKPTQSQVDDYYKPNGNNSNNNYQKPNSNQGIDNNNGNGNNGYSRPNGNNEVKPIGGTNYQQRDNPPVQQNNNYNKPSGNFNNQEVKPRNEAPRFNTQPPSQSFPSNNGGGRGAPAPAPSQGGGGRRR